MTDPYLEPDRRPRRIISDVYVRRRPEYTNRVMQVVPEKESPSTTTHQSKTAISHRPIEGFVGHVKRMASTAGQSWAVQEHDILLLPIQRFFSKLGSLFSTPLRKSKLLTGHTDSWKAAYFFILVLGLIAIPTSVAVHNNLQAQRYELSAATQKLIGQPVVALDKQLAYDKVTNSFNYNPGAINGLPTSTSDSDQIGGSQYYGLSLAANPSKGQTYTDATTKLSFSIIPEFGQLSGKHEDGHIVYPISGGQATYTIKDNGLKEDIVLTDPTDAATFSYKLDLPSTLQARQLSDGSIGVYSADPALFGNISYGDSADEQAVQKARDSGSKNNLVFAIPAPTILQSNGQTGGIAAYTLQGNTVTVNADKLENLTYPIAIDPSVVVSSANTFLSGNNEDNNAVISSASVGRSPLTGGVVNTVAADTTCGTTGSWCSINTGSAAYNGTVGARAITTVAATVGANAYLYAIGGNYSNNADSLDTLSYASITLTGASAGSLGAWVTSSNSLLNSSNGRSGVGAVVYNGYIYVMGGQIQGSTTASDVQYALICTGSNVGIDSCSSTAGSIGAWNTTNDWSALTSGSIPGGSVDTRELFGAVAYNNYIYVMGGVRVTGGSSFYQDSVMYAPINANGSLGTWQLNSTSLTNAGSATASVYNNHIYVFQDCDEGAATTTSGSTCTATNGGDVQIGTIASNGSISWSSTLAVPSYLSASNSGNRNPGVVISNGYLYICGGNAANVATATTVYAPIYANGSLGSFTTNSSLSALREEFTMTAYNGYLYGVGGMPTGTTTTGDTQYAKIDAAGTLGSFTSTTVSDYPSGGSAHFSQATAVTNGYIYQLGGGGPGNSAGDNEVYYALLCTASNVASATDGCATAGGIGTWHTSANTFTGSRINAAAAAYNGYLYISGGYSSSSGSDVTCSDIQYSHIGTAGAPGTWADALNTSSPTCSTGIIDFTPSDGNPGLDDHSMVAYNGYMYLLGGTNDTNSIDLGDVQYATICTGSNSTASIGTPAHACGATAGQLSGFQQTTAFPSGITSDHGLNSFGAVATGGYIYTFGGRTTTNLATGIATIQSAKFNANGTIGSWTDTTNALPNGLYGIGAAASNGVVYLVDGVNASSAATDATYYASIGGGVIGSFIATATPAAASPAPSTNQDGSAKTNNIRNFVNTVAANGYLYMLGGCDGPATSVCNSLTADIYQDTESAPLNNGGEGLNFTSNGSPATTTALGTATIGASSVALNGYLYTIGGNTGSIASPTATGTVARATISSSGGTLSWVTTDPAVTPTYGASIAVNDGTIYLIGGYNGSTYLSKIQYATPSLTTGAIASWSSASPGGMARIGTAAVAYNGYLYASGGYDGSLHADVDSIPINSNGSITASSWSSAGSSFSTARYGHQMLADNGYLYVLGGCSAGSGAACTANSALNDVQYATLGSSGTVSGSWVTTAPFNTPRYYFNATIYDGYLYVYGGSSTSTALGDIQYAPVSNTGVIGNWTLSGLALASTGVYWGSGAASGGYIYLIGGANTSGTAQTTSNYAGLQDMAHIADYSRLVDLGKNVEQSRYILTGTASDSGDGSNIISSSIATANSTTYAFGSSVISSGMPFSSNISNKSLSASIGEYAFVHVTIDDSQSSTFPENTPSSISGLQIFFNPNPQNRLRLGQTFTGTNSSTVNQLDTEGGL